MWKVLHTMNSSRLTNVKKEKAIWPACPHDNTKCFSGLRQSCKLLIEKKKKNTGTAKQNREVENVEGGDLRSVFGSWLKKQQPSFTQTRFRNCNFDATFCCLFSISVIVCLWCNMSSVQKIKRSRCRGDSCNVTCDVLSVIEARGGKAPRGLTL